MLADLTQALEERDAYSGGHTLRVTELATVLARRLGWDDRRLAALRLGGLLHDVGKLTLPRSLLRKPGPLDARELALVRLHPVVGARIVSPVLRGRAACRLILYARVGTPCRARIPSAAGDARRGTREPSTISTKTGRSALCAG